MFIEPNFANPRGQAISNNMNLTQLQPADIDYGINESLASKSVLNARKRLGPLQPS